MIKDVLTEDWNRSGIRKGDTVLIHSSLKRLIQSRFKNHLEKEPVKIILDSFFDAVGPSGTLVFPLFNFSFTEGIPFDIRTTPSQMGALTEVARLHQKAIRTGHPIYSFAVIGQKSDRFYGVNNFSGYGSDSPFGILRELNAKVAILGLEDQNSMTFYHHVEEMHNVSYRYHKKFKGKYRDEDGITTNRIFGLFVRDLELGVETHVNPMGELLWENGIYTGDRPNQGSFLRVGSLNKIYKMVSEIIEEGKAKGLLYRIAGEE